MVGSSEQAERQIFFNFHRQVFCWIDNWHGYSMADIRDLEDKTKRELDEVSRFFCSSGFRFSFPVLSPLPNSSNGSGAHWRAPRQLINQWCGLVWGGKQKKIGKSCSIKASSIHHHHHHLFIACLCCFFCCLRKNLRFFRLKSRESLSSVSLLCGLVSLCVFFRKIYSIGRKNSSLCVPETLCVCVCSLQSWPFPPPSYALRKQLSPPPPPSPSFSVSILSIAPNKFPAHH